MVKTKAPARRGKQRQQGKVTRLYTIGFTHKSAEQFFNMLRDAGIKRIVDVRLHNSNQLAGFSKKDDLKFFLKEICGIEYIHMPELAPTEEILTAYRKEKGPWDAYERAFRALLEQRQVEKLLQRKVLDRGCLLCSEPEPDHCHRRLIAEYLEKKLGNLETHHLM